MRTSTIAALLVSAAALAWASPASAQRRPSSEGSLFLLSFALGVGDCDDWLCGPGEKDTGPHLGFGVQAHVRPVPFFAIGGDFHYQIMSADAVDLPQDESADYMLANLSLRGYIPTQSIVEPWIGLGFGWAHWGYSAVDGGKERAHTLSGTDLAISAGVDVQVADHVAVGGMFRLAFPYWQERCKDKIEVDRVTEECRDVDTLEPLEQDQMPDMLWFLGAHLRLDF